MKAFYILIMVLLAGNSYGQAVSNWIQDERTGCKVFNQVPEPKESVQITGNCVNGYLEGQGVVIWNLNGKFNQKTEGLHLKGKLDGLSTLISSKGNKYVGEYKDSKRTGQGTFTSLNGDRYVGEWKDDKKNGQGTMTSNNGDVYVG